VTPRIFRCLAIDTSTDQPNVAACHGERTAGRVIGSAGRTEGIFTDVDAVLATVGLTLAELDCVAVGRGPGSFTGLRVGVAAAQALAFAAELPVCPVSSLAVLAVGAARRAGVTLVVAALDARMAEVYVGGYRIGAEDVDTVLDDCVADPTALAVPGAEAFLAAGPGWAAYPDLARRFANRVLAMDHSARPSATDLLVLAQRAFARGECVAASTVLPTYLRDRVTG
jgi:tRNA threonylcarbamoyladenosine biosynthesis protein TsaB